VTIPYPHLPRIDDDIDVAWELLYILQLLLVSASHPITYTLPYPQPLNRHQPAPAHLNSSLNFTAQATMQSIIRLRAAGPRVTAPARRQFTASTLRLAGGPGFKDGDSATSSSDATASKAIPKTNTDSVNLLDRVLKILY